MKAFFIVLLLLLCQTTIYSQEEVQRKSITINKTTKSPAIDGVLDDKAWENASTATNFVERVPKNGKPAPDSLRTEVKITYDDVGIYFGAMMFDQNPEAIKKELTERDAIGNDDFIIFLLNGYNDRQQSLEFAITAAGVQFDAKMTNGNEDSSWNAVWFSEAKINEEGWAAELFIPYSELRFPKKEVQEWGLNIEREVRRTRTRYSWSFIDNEKGSFSFYDGILQGIKNIETPTRLSLQPYVSSYVNNYDGETEVNFNGGMDLKYGINDAFTLDMILVPDFGQAKFDETVLNLSAFEVQYAEQRPFFTEGTELFTKGNLFYSRRIGGAPTGLVVGDDEEIVNPPSSVDLINAMKISGRTDNGLGIGFFNAVTERTFVNIYNPNEETTREELIEPLANYNILVLDQRFGDNSSVSLVNTNTLREGHFQDANVTGLYTNLTNKANTWNYFAGLEGSWVMQQSTKFGVEGEAGFNKNSGNWNYGASTDFRTKDYDINDLGYSSTTNYIYYRGFYRYRTLQPQWIFNEYNVNLNLVHMRRLNPDLYSNFIVNLNSFFMTKKFLAFGGGFETTPAGTQDIYEPRVDGLHVKIPAYYDQWFFISTDYRKQLALDATIDWYKYDEKGRGNLILEFSPRFRVSDKLTFIYGANFTKSDLEEGYAQMPETEPIFGERNRKTLINSLNSQYILNNKTAINLAFRHYYSEVYYNHLLTLEEDGELVYRGPDNGEYDATYNSWNIDLRFSWWFAPGSQMSILYRNAIENYENSSGQNFSSNLNGLFNQPQLNNISLRISYYLDYNRTKNWLSSRNESQAMHQSDRSKKKGRLTSNGSFL